ncbi:unnamed protein product [Ilex paraguariensis]|uniref:Uncharacterized protein n=1 Tax=Ilex paraguariensis TaxID=185542 RepID=A0ABC8TAQ4_9AQUA
MLVNSNRDYDLELDEIPRDENPLAIVNLEEDAKEVMPKEVILQEVMSNEVLPLESIPKKAPKRGIRRTLRRSSSDIPSLSGANPSKKGKKKSLLVTLMS